MSVFSCLIPSAGYYVKVMKKVQDKGDEYIKNEQERLGRILGELVIVKYMYKLITLDLSIRLGERGVEEIKLLIQALILELAHFKHKIVGGGVGGY